MKVAVVGATGVVGSAAVAALTAAGHDVVVPESSCERPALAAVFEGCDAVVSAVPTVPPGYGGLHSHAWRQNDRFRTDGVRTVVEAAREAHVRRVVHESVSLLYADHGDTWIDEQSLLDINPVVEPACVGESHVQGYQSDLCQGVVLRFGMVIGDEAATRSLLRESRRGRAIGMGAPEGWVHPVHTDDVGTAVLAALSAPGGVYNVGAEPVRRADLVQAYAQAVGRASGSFMGRLQRRLTGRRAEPATRSLRVSSQHFRATTGWSPTRGSFDLSWLQVPVVATDTEAVR